jgi:YD repeat-containing protein
VYSYRAANDPGCTSQPVNCTSRRGDLWKTTNAVGHVVENVAFDNLGRLTRQRDANQTITDLQYHARGWLTSRTIRANADGSPSAGDAQTRIEHEVYGEIKRVISPDGSGLEYCRDQVHRITAVVMTTLSQSTQCNGAVPLTGTTSIRFTLDNQGNRIREESRDSSDSVTKLLARQYNSLGQLRSLVNSRYANQPDLDSASVKK